MISNDNKNTIVAFVLILLILFGYNYFYTPSNNIREIAAPIRWEKPVSEEQKQLSNDMLNCTIDIKNGTIESVELKKYKKTKKSNENVMLIYGKDYILSGCSYGGILLHDDWVFESRSEENKITIKRNISKDVIQYRTFSIDDKYMVSVTDKVVNNSTQRINIHFSTRLVKKRSGGDSNTVHEGPISYLDGKLKEYNNGDKVSVNGSIGWVGISDKYWFCGVITDKKIDLQCDNVEEYNIIDITTSSATTVDIGSESSHTFQIYLGAKDVNLLDNYENTVGVKHLDLCVDFGYFYILTKPLFYLFDYITDIVKNMGLSIIVLTLLIKLCLLPFSIKTSRSTEKMRLIQPKIDALQKRYANDRTKLGQEMIDLYKKEKVNPASGCLIQLLQFPFLFALYKVFVISIDMRHADFLIWNDLSEHDTMYLLNCFGMIPIELPKFLQIGIMPVLVGITMFLQQKITPMAGDDTQKKIIKMLPFIFVFTMGQLSTALLLYWTLSNILSIMQQMLTKVKTK